MTVFLKALLFIQRREIFCYYWPSTSSMNIVQLHSNCACKLLGENYFTYFQDDPNFKKSTRFFQTNVVCRVTCLKIHECFWPFKQEENCWPFRLAYIFHFATQMLYWWIHLLTFASYPFDRSLIPNRLHYHFKKRILLLDSFKEMYPNFEYT